MGKMSREKGARGEREVVEIFRSHGLACDRTPNSGGLFIPGDVTGLGRFHIEVKRCERIDLSAWLKQAYFEANGNVPVVCFRRSNENWHAVTPLSLFAELIGALEVG